MSGKWSDLAVRMQEKWASATHYITFTLYFYIIIRHLADALIQSDLQ